MSITLFGGSYYFYYKSSNNINLKTIESQNHLVITGRFFAIAMVYIRRK